MEQAELTLRYRELDRDCALLSYRMHGPNEFEPKLFIPDESPASARRGGSWAGGWRSWQTRTRSTGW